MAMSKKGPSLAILLGSAKDHGEEDDAPASERGEGDDEKYTDLAKEAFPDEDWTPERVAALKELVMACMEER